MHRHRSLTLTAFTAPHPRASRPDTAGPAIEPRAKRARVPCRGSMSHAGRTTVEPQANHRFQPSAPCRDDQNTSENGSDARARRKNQTHGPVTVTAARRSVLPSSNLTAWNVCGNQARALCSGTPDPTCGPAQPAAPPSSAPGNVVGDPSIGQCARLRREFSGEPDAGNLHLRFDEGRWAGAVPPLPLLLYGL